MDPAIWRQVEELFAGIVCLPQTEHAAALASSGAPEAVKAQVRELLAFDGEIDLEQWGQSVQRLASDIDEQQLCGEDLGPWRLTTSLGQGGMGRVFLAERCDGRFEAKVAIKFVSGRDGRDLNLFDRERRILARLSHPGIARLIDAGEDDRLGAYLVMEYVDGCSLDQLVIKDGLGPLEIVAWMAKAARIVAHAHQNLVLHRDLKPDHLLIDHQGNLKILDFGVASLMQSMHGESQVNAGGSFTPRYAAPEQLQQLPAKTQTDVYALGMILFELLRNGASPFGTERETMYRRKIDGKPDPLGSVAGLNAAQLRNLEAIIARCLAANPDHRYPGPAELASDLSALGNDQAVTARASTAAESSLRWLRHNRLAGAALALAVVAMLTGTITSAWFGHLARVERDTALVEASKAREIANFLEGVFQASTPGLEGGPDVRARDLLEAGHERIGQELAAQPEVATMLELTIARGFLSLGLYDDALALLTTSRPGIPTDLMVEQRLLRARLQLLNGKYSEALDLLDPAWIEQLQRQAMMKAYNLQATALINLGQTTEAEHAARATLAQADDSEADIELALVAQGLLGAIAFSRQDYAAAREAYHQIHALNEQRHGSIHEETAQALHNLAGVLFMSGDLLAATQAYHQALRVKRAYYGVDNRSVAMTLRSLGLSYRRQGQAMPAEQSLREAVTALRSWNEPSSFVYQEAVVQLMELFALQKRPDEVAQLLVDLPVQRHRDSMQEREIHCRIERFRALYTHDHLLDSDCADFTPTVPAVKAFDLFLRASHSFAAKRTSAENERKIALEAARQLQPPDPMLETAINRLGQS